MSSGTFAYPLCFTAMLVAIGLVVLPHSERLAPVAKSISVGSAGPGRDAIAAEMLERCDEFIRRYPDSDYSETVAEICMEHFVARGDWKELAKFCRELENKMPQSEVLDRCVFFHGFAFYQDSNFKEAVPQFERVMKSFPTSCLVESSLYYLAMSHYLGKDYRGVLTTAAAYLEKFPEGRYSGEMQYRLSFIDFNDKEVDQSDKIIRDLSTFLATHPDDPTNGSMLCLLGDVYKLKATAGLDAKAGEDRALEAYAKAVLTASPDDVILYALESATDKLVAQKNWSRITRLYQDLWKSESDRLKRSYFGVSSNGKFETRGSLLLEAAKLLAGAIRHCIGDPTNNQVEIMLGDLAWLLSPRWTTAGINPAELDRQLVGILSQTIAGQKNATTVARIEFARARLAELSGRRDLSDLYLKGIATNNAKDPSGLSPQLLETCGWILLKQGDLHGAEMMFKRLRDHFPDSLYADVGALGLGKVAFARKKPDAALAIFEVALKKPGNTRFNEAKLGKLQALVDLDQLEAAEKLALEIVGDKQFRGETAAKAYLQLARIYRRQAAKAQGEVARDLLRKAHGIYQRVFIAYKSFPELGEEANREAAEVLKELAK